MIDNRKLEGGEYVRRVSDGAEFMIAVRPHKGSCGLVRNGDFIYISTKELRTEYERVEVNR